MLNRIARLLQRLRDAFMFERAVIVQFDRKSIEVSYPVGSHQSIEWSSVQRILVETNDSGPWGTDVWWILDGGQHRCAFPQGATGEQEALEEIQRRFPTFAIDGMNSTTGATFLCWPR